MRPELSANGDGQRILLGGIELLGVYTRVNMRSKKCRQEMQARVLKIDSKDVAALAENRALTHPARHITDKFPATATSKQFFMEDSAPYLLKKRTL
jgi:hypothetical protein